MDDVLKVAKELEQYMTARHWRFAFIGGVANLAWGEIRTTQDVDITLFTSFDGEAGIVREILESYESRITDPLNFALRARVILAQSAGGVGIDIGLAGFPYEELVIERRRSADLGNGIILSVISAEDLVVMKAFAGRNQDWADVEGVSKRQGPKLDWEYVLQHAGDMALIKEDDEMLPRLKEIRVRFAN